MSIKIMAQVFNDDNLEPMKKLIMLAIADNANDNGVCYPSIDLICSKTSLSNKTVIKHIKELEKLKLLYSKYRTKKNKQRNTKKYLIYPEIYYHLLDEDDEMFFKDYRVQSEEATLRVQSEEATPKSGVQSEEATPKPSLSLFNHHLYKQLTKREKELFLEYISFRKKKKLPNSLKIQDRLLKKYFEFGRNIEVIEKAIVSGWRDFYALGNSSYTQANKNANMAKLDSIKEFLNTIFTTEQVKNSKAFKISKEKYKDLLTDNDIIDYIRFLEAKKRYINIGTYYKYYEELENKVNEAKAKLERVA